MEVIESIRGHWPAFLRLAHQLTHDHEQAEDLVQDAAVRVLQRARTNHRIDHPVAYMRQTIVHGYLDRKRQAPRSASLLTFDRSSSSPDGDPAEPGLSRALLWAQLNRLTKRERTVLVLRFYCDLPDTEIAELLRCRPATVRSISARAIAGLRRRMTEPELRREETHGY